MVDSGFLQEKFDSHFLSYLKGESEMSVSYLNDGEWVVESSLQGMSIELPYPFAKKAQDIQPIALTIYPPDGNENYYCFLPPRIKSMLNGQPKLRMMKLC